MVGTGVLPRHRMLRALCGERVDVLPAGPCYLGLFLDDFERAFYLEQYRLRVRGLDRYSVDHSEDTQFRAHAVYQSYGIFKLRADWMDVPQGGGRAWAARTEIVRTDGVLCWADRETGLCVPMHLAPMPRGDDALALPTMVRRIAMWDSSHRVRSREDVDRQAPLLSAELLLAQGDFDLARQVVADHGDEQCLSYYSDTPFSHAFRVVGFPDILMLQHDDPGVLRYLLERCTAQLCEEARAWKSVGVHVAFACEMFSGGDMISPRAFDEWVHPYNVQFFRELGDLELLSVFQLCGAAVPRLDRMVEAGPTAVSVEESKKDLVLEIDQVVEKVNGRVAVLGNIDTIRFGLNGTMEEMAAEVKRQASFGARARGFVVGTGSPFPPNTNPRNVDALVSAAHSIPG